MDKNNIAITNSKNVCFNCLKETTINEVEIHSMGWGSGFDGWSTKIQLCNDCISSTNQEWWKLKVIEGKTEMHGSYYEYEDEIFEFAKQMPLAGQELFWNRYSYGWNSHGEWGAQDYIDYKLGILPHDKCKEYSVYSHDEIKAYEERFPVCQHPFNLVFEDGSAGCWCPFGAHGEKGQLAGGNISNECYGCKHFTERTTPLRDIPNKEHSAYKTYYKAKLMQEEYKNMFE